MLPDCMMPDGADPCAGYTAERDRACMHENQLEQHIVDLDQELTNMASAHDALVERLNRAREMIHRAQCFGAPPAPLGNWLSDLLAVIDE
jgi:hypothetical protein